MDNKPISREINCIEVSAAEEWAHQCRLRQGVYNAWRNCMSQFKLQGYQIQYKKYQQVNENII